VISVASARVHPATCATDSASGKEIVHIIPHTLMRSVIREDAQRGSKSGDGDGHSSGEEEEEEDSDEDFSVSSDEEENREDESTYCTKLVLRSIHCKFGNKLYRYTTERFEVINSELV
jgi:hypothetical protein